MKKQIIILALVLTVIMVITGCKGDTAENPGNSDSTAITGRIIEILDGSHIIIRNEEDTSIYFKIDTSNGLAFSSGVNEILNPDNVITADVEILNSESLPKETKLIAITGNKAPDYRIIDAEQAKVIIDQSNVIIIDARTRVEFDSGYIPEAYNIPYDQIDKRIENVTDNKDAKILVYCRSGNRSKVAARTLTEMGYTNVYDFGGIVNWPYEIIEH